MSGRTLDRASLQKLAAIYRFRALRAESDVREQRGVIARVREELAERTGKVDALSRSLERNEHYMRSPEVNSDARAMERAIRYRHWLDYDRQRETFYLEMTRDEHREAMTELQRRTDVLGRIQAKESTVEGLDRDAARDEDRLAELDAEEEAQALWSRKERDHVKE